MADERTFGPGDTITAQITLGADSQGSIASITVFLVRDDTADARDFIALEYVAPHATSVVFPPNTVAQGPEHLQLTGVVPGGAASGAYRAGPAVFRYRDGRQVLVSQIDPESGFVRTVAGGAASSNDVPLVMGIS